MSDAEHECSTSEPGQQSLVVLEKIVAAADTEDASIYNCPLCRKPQVLNIESLQVDQHLSKFVEELRLQLKSNKAASDDGSEETASMSSADCEVLIEPEGGWLLPPQKPEFAVSDGTAGWHAFAWHQLHGTIVPCE